MDVDLAQDFGVGNDPAAKQPRTGPRPRIARGSLAVEMHAGAPPFRAVVKARARVRAAGERALDGTFLLLDVLAEHADRGPADGPREIRPGPQALRAPVVAHQFGELLAQPLGRHPL